MHEHQPPLKVVLLGESGSGKTSIITRYTEGIFTGGLEPTVGGLSSAVKFDFEGHIFDLVLWDTAGQEKYRGLTPMYYRSAMAAIIVFDLTNHESFEQVPAWISELQANVGSIVIAICGNKSDCGESRVIDQENARALAESARTLYCETSAKTGKGIEYLFQTVVMRLLEGNPELIGPVCPSLPIIKPRDQSDGQCC
jgi:small GTP-binding protein